MISATKSQHSFYGIELLNANEQLRRDDQGTLLIINEAAGERVEVPLAAGPA